MLQDDEHKDSASVTLVASLSRDATEAELVRRRMRVFLGLLGVHVVGDTSVHDWVMIPMVDSVSFAVSSVSWSLPILAASSASRRSSLRRSLLLARAESGRMRLSPRDELAVVVVIESVMMDMNKIWL